MYILYVEVMFSVLQLVVIGGFQCAKPGHTTYFRKIRSDARPRQKKRTCPG